MNPKLAFFISSIFILAGAALLFNVNSAHADATNSHNGYLFGGIGAVLLGVLGMIFLVMKRSNH